MADYANSALLNTDFNRFSVLSYNMHGFNQGCVMLQELCKCISHEFIFLQEHWMSSAVINKILNIDANYLGFGISAMESVVSAGILKGRPFGGTAILAKKCYAKYLSNIMTFDRVVSVTVFDILLINTYMPCEDGSLESLDTVHEILANISDIIESSTSNYIIFGGDLNVNLKGKSPHAVAINDFLLTYKIQFGQKAFVPGCNQRCDDNAYYTFSNEKSNRYSTIDYLCFSKSLADCVTNYDVINDATNHSDHLPVCLTFNLPSSSSMYHWLKFGVPVSCKSNNEGCNSVRKASSLRWDHADTDSYYYMTSDLLYPIYNEILDFDGNINDINYAVDKIEMKCEERIEDWYIRSINALRLASDTCIPCIPQNCLKPWWNSELNELKKQSIMSHSIWLQSGKPRDGPLFVNKNKDKLNYKFKLKKQQKESESIISNNLQESLISKNSKCFWKTWKTKVCNKNSSKVLIDGNPTDSEACSEFATFLKTTVSPNCSDFDSEKSADYVELFSRYAGDMFDVNKFNFNAELLAFAISKTESGKSPGTDEVTIEHIIHSHPVAYALYAKLFNIMLRFSYVPRDFGQGITIPIPKNSNCRGSHAIDSFRGITLSTTISKLFERCILVLFSDYLNTSQNQFGFKANVGCTRSILTLRKVVEYYNYNGSTVNMCFLDIAKGFDKMNHYVLLIKLMKRRLPKVLVALLQYWFSISYNKVRWGEMLSQPYKLLAGVRQGGVLSPVLFSIYVDGLLNKFRHFGCRYLGLSTSALMFADDIVLVAPSVTELQTMLDMFFRIDTA